MFKMLVVSTLESQRAEADILARVYGHKLSWRRTRNRVGPTHIGCCSECSATVTLFETDKVCEAHKAGDALFRSCPVMNPGEKFVRLIEFLHKQRDLLTGGASWRESIWG